MPYTSPDVQYAKRTDAEVVRMPRRPGDKPGEVRVVLRIRNLGNTRFPIYNGGKIRTGRCDPHLWPKGCVWDFDQEVIEFPPIPSRETVGLPVMITRKPKVESNMCPDICFTFHFRELGDERVRHNNDFWDKPLPEEPVPVIQKELVEIPVDRVVETVKEVVKEKIVEKVVVEPATPPCDHWVEMMPAFRTPESLGGRFRRGRDQVVIDVRVSNTSNKDYPEGWVTTDRSSMFSASTSHCPPIASGKSVMVEVVLEWRGGDGMIPVIPLTYTSPNCGSYTEALFNPVFMYLGELGELKPTLTITDKGAAKTKPYFVVSILGRKGSGKSSICNSLHALSRGSHDQEGRPCGVDGTAGHCTKAISVFRLHPDWRFAGLDVWGTDSERWQEDSHIRDFLRGYIRHGITMEEPQLAAPLTDARKEELEATRQLNQVNAVALTITAQDLLAGEEPNMTGKGTEGRWSPLADVRRIKKVATATDATQVILIVTMVDLLETPNGAAVREDTESPEGQEARRVLVQTAREKLGFEESDIFLSVGRNAKGVDTEGQRWNIDRMHLQILTGLTSRAVTSDTAMAEGAEAILGDGWGAATGCANLLGG